MLSTAYLAWGVAAQREVEHIARTSLAAQGIGAERVLVTPTPFNSVLWRVGALEGEYYHEGFYSLLDADPAIAFDRFPRGTALARELGDVDGVQRVASFSKGFFKLRDDGSRVLISDLRMGQEPNYTFTFAVADRRSPAMPLLRPEQVGSRPDIGRVLPWLWQRALGERMPPPR